MNKKTRIIAIILCIVTLVSTIAPLVVNAQQENTQTEIVVPQHDVVTISTTNDGTDDNSDKNESTWDGICAVTVKLNANVPEKTDNIVLQFIPKGGIVALANVVLSRENNFVGTVNLKPGQYSIAFSTADNKYEVELNENKVEIPEAKSAELTVTAKKIQDGSFFATFWRNNSLLLILLAICSVTYFILKRRREKMYQ